MTRLILKHQQKKPSQTKHHSNSYDLRHGMNIAEAIISRILTDQSVTLTQLEQRATERAVSLSDLYVALDKVHRDKRIKRGVRQGEVYYEPAPPPKTPTDHLTWLRQNYPPMDSTNDGSGIDLGDLSWMFLKTKEERDAFKTEMSGKPVGYNKRYGKKER